MKRASQLIREEKEEDIRLLLRAKEARMNAYAPYSGFTVGAALMDKDGEIHLGCNIESASYTPTNCAERTALFKAVSEGKHSFRKIAIVGAKKAISEETKEDERDALSVSCPPCGVCRQVMMEFCNPNSFEIILADKEEEFVVYKLEELLPLGFGPANL